MERLGLESVWPQICRSYWPEDLDNDNNTILEEYSAGI